MPANEGNLSGQTSPVTRSVSTQALVEVFSVRAPDPIKFLNIILQEAVALSASDVLFEPSKTDLKVRIRIDGVLYELGKVDVSIHPQIASKVKVMSKLDPTDKRKIQEGQFTTENEGRSVNMRVEVAQIIYGELIVIRIHEKQTIVMKLAELGFSNKSFENYKSMLGKKSGLVLVSGPTGSGKTTTLYSTISKLSTDQLNIMTIEDPVEFQLDGINQMQVHNDTGFTFAVGLKTILRLSPDVVLVGEIRDAETAGIAVESGLTGQLVLTTVHAQDSVSALFRLLDLGIEPYLLNSALSGIVAQRLVRKNCEACKGPYQPTEDELSFFKAIMGRAPQKLMKSNGCTECNSLAFKGRTGIYEVLTMDARLRDMIRKKLNEDTLRSEIKNVGFINLLSDGLMKAEMGLTTISEVLRNSFKVV